MEICNCALWYWRVEDISYRGVLSTPSPLRTHTYTYIIYIYIYVYITLYQQGNTSLSIVTWTSWGHIIFGSTFHTESLVLWVISSMVSLSTSAQTEPGSSWSTCQHPEHPKTWFRWALQNLVICSMGSLMAFAQTVLKGSRYTFSCLHEVNWL